GRFGAELGTLSALRWGLAMCFLTASALLWLRGPLGRVADRIGCALDGPAALSTWTRNLFVCGAAVPCVILTLAHASEVLREGAAGGAGAAGRLIGGVASPLLVISRALVGHALRERSAGFAFAAGLVVTGTIMGSSFLHAALGGALDSAGWVRILQLGVIGT